MTADQRRFARQIRLKEVGAMGQTLIASAVVSPRSVGNAREVEVLYLERVGSRVALEGGAAHDQDADIRAVLDVLALETPAAAEVAEGAIAALVAVREALGLR